MITLKLWLHREERDAWLVSVGGLGAGVYLPKSEIAIEQGHAVPVLAPVGPIAIELPEWLADDRGLRNRPDINQGDLF